MYVRQRNIRTYARKALSLPPADGRARIAVDRLYWYKYTPCVSKDEPLPIVFYKTSGGDEPVRNWLLSLPGDVRKEIGGDVRNVQDGWPLGKPYVDGFGGGLYEVRTSYRGQQYRVLFVILEETMILLHGFQKKTQ